MLEEPHLSMRLTPEAEVTLELDGGGGGRVYNNGYFMNFNFVHKTIYSTTFHMKQKLAIKFHINGLLQKEGFMYIHK
jgi:hypothetical protein